MSWRDRACDLALLGGSLALYLPTVCPTVYSHDSAELAAGAHTLGIVHSPGYPLYLLLVKAFMLVVPWGDMAYRANLFSALCASLALVVVRRVMRALGASPGASLAAAAALGASFPFWSQAVAAEVYTLHVLLMAMLLALCLAWRDTGRTRWLLLAGLVFGFSVANHLSTVLLLPALASFVPSVAVGRRLPARAWAGVLGVTALGPLTYLYLPLRQAAGPAVDYAAAMEVDLSRADGLAWMIRGDMFADLMFGYQLHELPLEVLRFGALAWRAFLGAGPGLAALGLIAQWRRDPVAARTLAVAAGVTAAFFVGYRVPDKDTMFLTPLAVMALWMALGLDELLAWAARAPGTRRRRAVQLGAVAVLGALVVTTHPRVDLGGYVGVRRYAEAVLDELPPHAFVVGGWAHVTPLLYLQAVEGQRPDVVLFDWGLYGLGRRARLRAEGLTPEGARQRALDEILVLVQRELLAARPVYSLEDNLLLREWFVLVPQRRVARVCEAEACDGAGP